MEKLVVDDLRFQLLILNILLEAIYINEYSKAISHA